MPYEVSHRELRSKALSSGQSQITEHLFDVDAQQMTAGPQVQAGATQGH